jgi:hypothetical protein
LADCAAATGLRPEEWFAPRRRHIDRDPRVAPVERKKIGAKIVPGRRAVRAANLLLS